jgi:hypothetical protein
MWMRLEREGLPRDDTSPYTNGEVLLMVWWDELLVLRLLNCRDRPRWSSTEALPILLHVLKVLGSVPHLESGRTDV